MLIQAISHKHFLIYHGLENMYAKFYVCSLHVFVYIYYVCVGVYVYVYVYVCV